MCSQVECTINELLKIEGVIVVGPDFKDKNKLRVYADGGRIGKIYVGKRNDGKHELISSGYFSHYEKSKNKMDSEENLGKIVTESTNHLETLKSDIYITQAKIAINKKNGDEERTNDSEPSERHVETSIVKKFMNKDNNKNWSVIDMEVEFPKDFFKGHNFSDGTTRQPRFDIVVVNNKGIGFLELKVNNKNVDNLESHYEHMLFLLQNPKKFLNEIQRRMRVIKPYNLISESALNASLKAKSLWCGFLFVGGEIKKSIVEPLSEKDKIEDFNFLYYDNMEDFSLLNMNETEWKCYADYIKGASKE